MLETQEELDSAPRSDRLTDAEVAPAPDRSTYIGGGDIAAIAGADPYKSALDVYMRKLGLVEEEPLAEAGDWGVILEPVVAAEYEKRERVQLEPSRFIQGRLPFIGGTPDRFVAGMRRGVEIKTAGLRQAAEWGDEDDAIPDKYALQCHYYMALTGFVRWDVAVLIGGQEFRVYRLRADAELGAYLVQLATTFWRQHVEANVPPPPGGTEAAKEALAKLYKSHRPELLQSTEEIDLLAEQLRVATLDAHAADARKLEAENALKAIIGDAAGIEGSWGRITWKKAKDSERIDLKALRADPVALAAVTPHIRPKAGGRRFLSPWSKKPKTNPGADAEGEE